MNRRLVHWLSAVMMVAGAALLLVSGGYAAYAHIAEANFAALRQTADFTVPSVSGPSALDAVDGWSVQAAALARTEHEDGWGARLRDGSAPTAGPAVAIPFVSAGPFPPATRVQIPRLDIDSPVTELGTKYVNGELVWDTPKFSVGHHRGTAQPGENGNAVFSGHISSPLSNEGNVFSRLPEIKLGDAIIVSTPVARIQYVVTETKVVDPSRIEIMDPTPEPQATFITCYPDWVYTHRFIVIARPTRWEFIAAPAPAS